MTLRIDYPTAQIIERLSQPGVPELVLPGFWKRRQPSSLVGSTRGRFLARQDQGLASAKLAIQELQ